MKVMELVVSAKHFSGPNADLEYNDPQFTLAEAFYWTSFPVPDVRDHRLELTIGKIDPSGIFDANEVANSETDQFMADLLLITWQLSLPVMITVMAQVLCCLTELLLSMKRVWKLLGK